MYGGGASEEFLGAGLGSRLDDVIVATKFLPRPADEPYTPGGLARRIREGCETSLRRLGTDRIDLYYQHYPDTVAPADEALEALDSLRQAGKVEHIAVSNPDPAYLRATGDRIVAVQLEWNLLSRSAEAELVPIATELGLGVVPYFPLASGLLTGKYRSNQPYPPGSRLDTMPYFGSVATPDNFDRVERLQTFADGRGFSLTELAVTWLLDHPAVGSVICGATSPDQVRANASAADCTLDPGDLQRIDAVLTEPRP